MDDGNSNKKAKGKSNYVIKRIHKCNDYKICLFILFKNEILLKSQERFKSKSRNVYTEEINKIVLNCNNDKSKPFIQLQHIHMDTNTGKVCKTELLKCKKWFNFDDYTNENKAEHNPKWPYIPDHLNRILIKGGSVLGKANAL